MTTPRAISPRAWLALDAVAALVVLVYEVRPALHARGAWLPFWALVGLSIAAAGAVAGRRLRPGTASLLGLVAGAVLTVATGSRDPLVAFLLCTYIWAQASADRRRAALATLAGIVGSACLAVRPTLGWTWLALTLAAVATSLALGRAVGGMRQADQRRVAAEQDAALARQAAALTEQRLAIARDLHDIVGNGLGIIALRADVAAAVGHPDPDTGQALAAIQDTARQTLDEVRQLVGMLREPDRDATQAPGLGGIDRLLEPARDHGVNATFHATGDPSRVPAGVSAAAFRIAQEAISNALRHADPHTITVRATLSPDHLAMTIENDGVTRPPAPAGHGLRGMAERAALYDGAVNTRQDGDWFLVDARLALPREVA